MIVYHKKSKDEQLPEFKNTGDLVFIAPSFLSVGTVGYNAWVTLCEATEYTFFRLLEWGLTIQEAKIILPKNCIIPEVEEDE